MTSLKLNTSRSTSELGQRKNYQYRICASNNLMKIIETRIKIRSVYSVYKWNLQAACI